METDKSYDDIQSAARTGQESELGRALWYIVVLTLVLVGVVALVLFLTRGSRRSSTAGRPVPAPSFDTVGGTQAGSAPQPGEMVITLGAERTENAHLKYALAVASSEPATEGAGVRTAGTVQSNAYKEVPVLPVVGGIVKQVNVQTGDKVKRGQVLATIFSNELAESQAAYLGMQAEAERHHQHYSRTAELVELGAASREELEQATAEAKTEQARLNSMREKLTLLGMTPRQIDQLKTADQIRAIVSVESPASGTILSRSVNPGEVMMNGKEMFRVVDLSSVWVIGQIYERDFGVVRLGAPAVMTVAAFPEKQFTGRVSYIDPRVDPQTRTAQVRVEVPNPGEILKVGMFVDVNFGSSTQSQTKAHEAALVPSEAVQTIGSKQVVYVVTERPDSFIQRDIVAGVEHEGMVPVLSGLTGGERVVTEGSFLLRSESLKLNPGQNSGISSPLPTKQTENTMNRTPHTRSEASNEAATPKSSTSPRVQAATVKITANGYQPATITLRRGVPARVTFLREIEATCSTDVVIEALGIKKELPFKEPIVVEFTPTKAGEIQFACGMNMLHGKMIVR